MTQDDEAAATGDMEAVTARDGRTEATARRRRHRGTNGWSQGQVVGERGRRTRRRHARGGGDLPAPDGVPCTEAVAARLGCRRVPCRHPHPPPSVPAQRGRCSSWLRSSPSPRPPPPPPPRAPPPPPPTGSPTGCGSTGCRRGRWPSSTDPSPASGRARTCRCTTSPRGRISRCVSKRGFRG